MLDVDVISMVELQIRKFINQYQLDIIFKEQNSSYRLFYWSTYHNICNACDCFQLTKNLIPKIKCVVILRTCQLPIPFQQGASLKHFLFTYLH
jgi:hypothetical protein